MAASAVKLMQCAQVGEARQPIKGKEMTVEISIVLICEIRQGKLLKIREYFDLLTTTEPSIPCRLYS
jgi:hypothetical protein